MVTFFIGLVDYFLAKVIRYASWYEKHETITKLHISVAIKMTIAKFLNETVVLVMVNLDSDGWYSRGNLVLDAHILMLCFTFFTPIVYIFNFEGLIKKAEMHWEELKGENCELTQREANELCEGRDVDVSDNLSSLFSYVMTCLFYSPIIPQAIPICLVGTFLNYWAYKYMLLRKHNHPKMLSDLLPMFFSHFLPWIIFFQSLAFIWFASLMYGKEKQ